MAFPRDPKILAIYETLEYDDKAAQQLAEEAKGPIETTLQAESALARVYLYQGLTEKAFQEAESAVSRAQGAGDRYGEATAVNSLALLYCYMDPPDTAKALAKAAEANKIYLELGNGFGMADVARTQVTAHLTDKKNVEARAAIQGYVDGYKKGSDRQGTAACLVVLSEACFATSKNAEAVKAAKEAAQIFQEIGDKPNEALAYWHIASADMMNPDGDAVWAMEKRTNIFKELGDQVKEAQAMIDLAQAHVAKVGVKMATCAIASTESTMGGLRTAKEAYSLHTSLGDREGMDAARRLFQRILIYNGVRSSVIENVVDPEETYQDIMSGKYSTKDNAFPPAPQMKQPKVEEIIPTAKQLDRAKFQWQYPNAGYSYTLIWQSVKERNVTNKKPRGSYDLLTLNTGTKSTSLAQAFTAMCNDANEKNKAMVIYMTSQDHNAAYATNIISQQSTMACMITARLSTLTFVQFGEGHFDWTDIRARQVNMYPVTLALARSCRIEAPTVNIGFVGGDAASWMADPLPLIENLFDTLESDECEVMYRRGEAYGPLIVHRPMEEGVTYVKAKKGLTVFYK